MKPTMPKLAPFWAFSLFIKIVSQSLYTPNSQKTTYFGHILSKNLKYINQLHIHRDYIKLDFLMTNVIFRLSVGLLFFHEWIRFIFNECYLIFREKSCTKRCYTPLLINWVVLMPILQTNFYNYKRTRFHSQTTL